MTEITKVRKWGTVGVACLAQLLLAVDLTVLHLAVPSLVEDLNPSSTQLLWIADVYGFALAGLLITMGNLSDRIGRKRLLLLGCATFGIASVLTAYAPNAEILIAARALLGVAGATVMPSTLSLIRNVFTDPKERTAAIGAWSGISIVGFALGPLAGGLLLNHFWWGSVFLINVPVVALIIGLGAVLLPESRNPSPGRLDAASVLLSVVGAIAVVYTIKEVAYKGIDHTDVVIAAVLGIAALILFVRRQTRLAEPLIDVRLFRNRAFAATVGSTLVAMLAMLASALIFALYFQLVVGWSPLKAGLASMPGAGGAVVGGVLSAAVVSALGRAGTIATGLGLSAVGFLLYLPVGVTVNYPYLLIPMILFGAGLAMTLTVATDTVLASAPRQRAGAASAISETATELGGALGIAVLGSLLSAVYRSNLALPAEVPAQAAGAIRESIGNAVAASAHLPGQPGQAVLESARQAYVDGIHVTSLASAALLAVLAVSTLFTLRGVPKVIAEEEEESGVNNSCAHPNEVHSGVMA